MSSIQQQQQEDQNENSSNETDNIIANVGNAMNCNSDDSDSQMSSSSSSSSSSSTSVASSATNSSNDSIYNNNNSRFSSSNSFNGDNDDDDSGNGVDSADMEGNGDEDDVDDDSNDSNDTQPCTDVSENVSASIMENNKSKNEEADKDEDLETDVDLICSEQEILNQNNESQPSTTSNTTKTTSSSTTSASLSKSSPDESTTDSSSIFSNNNNPTDTRRRVKLYMLNANRTWDDRGTGHVSSSYIDRLNGMSLLVRAETDGSTLLESKIMPDTAYQKQQDTLIVWSEGENYDLALSFQERIGCEEIWAKICQVQGKDPSVDITQDLIEDEDNELPPVEISRLDEIISILSSSLTTASKKDNITLALESDNYIIKLLELFRQLEERQDIPSLQKIYEIFKNIFLLNKSTLIEIMLSDQAICDVIGVFEYDPNGARVRDYQAKTNIANIQHQHKSLQQPSSSSSQSPSSASTSSGTTTTHALSSQSQSYFTHLPSSSESELMRLVREKRHREFLRNVSRFKEVIPLSKSELVSKIHQTYRVQYIQDVIMPSPSIFEDNMLSTLSSLLFFNKIEIVTLIQEDEKFLKELFRQLSDTEPSFQEKRRDLVLFLKELCTFSHTLQNRETFIKTLSSFGLLQTIETLLICDDAAIKLGAVDLLTYVVDYSPSMVREYALQQEMNTDKPAEQYIINIIIEQMICDNDPDLGMAQQLSGILKMIIDPDNMLTTPALNKTEKSEFLNYFYKHCICYLTSPILVATASTVAPSSLPPPPPPPPLPPPVSTANQSDLSSHTSNHSNGTTAGNTSSTNHPATTQSSPTSTTNSLASLIQNSSILSTSEPLKLAFENSCQAAQLLAIILELLTFCIEHHAHNIRTYLLQKEIVRRIMILTKSRHTFLVLTVIRFMRKLVGLKDEFYNRHIVTFNQFQPIIDAFLSNNGRYNLLDSAVIDLFEFIDQNEIYTLLIYTIERFWKNKLERINYVRTFKSMKRRFDQQQHRNPNPPNALMLSRTGLGAGANVQSPLTTYHHRFRRDPRQLDKEEDMWFNADDDDDEEECPDDDDDEDDDIGVGNINYSHHNVTHHHHHHHSGEDDDDDLITGNATAGSDSPNSNQTSNALENHLVLSSAAAALSAAGTDPIDYAAAQHHHYGQHALSLNHQHGKVGNPGSVLHHQHHLQISSLHHGTSGGNSANTINSGASTISLSSSYNNLTAATNSLYHHDTSTVSPTSTSSTAVAFVDSPFFSLASVASVTSVASQTASGTMGTGSGLISISKKKSNDRKLTINLNHKTTNFLAAASGTLSTQHANLNQQLQTNQPKTSNNVLSAFSSGLSLSSINSSIAAVAASVQQSSHDIATSITGTTTVANSQLRTNAHSHQFSSIGKHLAAAAAAFQNLNNNSSANKSLAENVRKALVDYSDEDSDDEDTSETAGAQKDDQETVNKKANNDVSDENIDEKNEKDMKEKNDSFDHHHSKLIHIHSKKSISSSIDVGINDSLVKMTKKNRESKSCSKHHSRSANMTKLLKSNPVANDINESFTTESKTNGSDKSESSKENLNDNRVSSSSHGELSVLNNQIITDKNNEKENLSVNRKRKSTDDSLDDDDNEDNIDDIVNNAADDNNDIVKQEINDDDDHQSNISTSKIEEIFTTVTDNDSNKDPNATDNNAPHKRFRYSFIESDENT